MASGPRSIWNGTLTFGLVNVPVKVFTAQDSQSIHFHQVHLKDEARIEHRKICPKEDKEVSSDEIVKGYELSDGGIVVLEKEEIAAAAGENAKLIDVETFVPDEQLDPIFYEKTYYLGAGDEGEAAFRLLRKALDETGRVAIGRWVFHDRERLVAVKPLDGVLGMHVMNFHDEVVEPDDLDLPSPQKNPTERELEMAGKLVKSLQAKFEPGRYKDTYRAAVLEVIERKRSGEDIEAPEPEPKEEPGDLVAALEASLG